MEIGRCIVRRLCLDEDPTRARSASPTPSRLAASPLGAIGACDVGYRDRYIKLLARAVVDGVALEAVRRLPREEAQRELIALPVGRAEPT